MFSQEGITFVLSQGIEFVASHDTLNSGGISLTEKKRKKKKNKKHIHNGIFWISIKYLKSYEINNFHNQMGLIELLSLIAFYSKRNLKGNAIIVWRNGRNEKELAWEMSSIISIKLIK